MNTRQCYTGSEGVRDIVNDYDPETYTLPYGFENQFFRLQYRPHEGVTAFVDKRTGQDLLGKGEVPLFTPVYQCTPLRHTKRPAPRNMSGGCWAGTFGANTPKPTLGGWKRCR